MFRRLRRPSFPQRLAWVLWPRTGWRRAGVYLAHRLRRLPGTPHSIAAGFACGAAISFTPFLGLHFLFGAAGAWLMGGNLFASAVGTVVGNPWTFPLIWLSSFQLGELILGPSPSSVSPLHLDLSFDVITESFASLWPTLKPMIVGGVVMGFVLGGAFYLLVRSTVIMSQSLRAARLAAAAQNRAAREHEAAHHALAGEGSDQAAQ